MCGIRVDRLVAGAVLAVIVATANAPAVADSQTECRNRSVGTGSRIRRSASSDRGRYRRCNSHTHRTGPRAARDGLYAAPTGSDHSRAPGDGTDIGGLARPEGHGQGGCGSPARTIGRPANRRASANRSRKPERKKDRALDAFYSSRNYAPLWIDHGVASERAKKAAAFLAKVDADGLDPADYPVPEIKAGADIAERWPRPN